MSGRSRCPEGSTDEQVLFLSDIFPTAYMAADHCEITTDRHDRGLGLRPGRAAHDQSCFLLGAKRVIAVDTVPERLALAREAGAETIDYAQGKVQETILELTGGQGPDAVIEAVGMESHGAESLVQKVASAVQPTVSAIERPFALNQAILACRPGGIVSVPGVYVGLPADRHGRLHEQGR